VRESTTASHHTPQTASAWQFVESFVPVIGPAEKEFHLAMTPLMMRQLVKAMEQERRHDAVQIANPNLIRAGATSSRAHQMHYNTCRSGV
jgi:hypothetical protein